MSGQKTAFDKIHDVTTRAEAHTRRLTAGRDHYLQHHLPRVVALTWRRKCGHALSPDAAKALHIAHKRVKYEAGVTGEDLLRLLFALDAIEGEGEVRAARKQAVQQVNGIIEQCDQLRHRAAKLDKLVDALQPPATQTETAAAAATATAAADTTEAGQEHTSTATDEQRTQEPEQPTAPATPANSLTDSAEEEEDQSDAAQPTAAAAAADSDTTAPSQEQSGDTTAAQEHADSKYATNVEQEQQDEEQEQEDEEDEEDENEEEDEQEATDAPEQAPSSKPQPSTSIPTDADATEPETELDQLLATARGRWPRVDPQWQEENDQHAVYLRLRLPSVRREHLRVTADQAKRTVTVTGVQLPSRQQPDLFSFFAAQPRASLGAWFSQELDIPDTLSLDQMDAVFRQGVLTICLPRRRRVLLPQPRHQEQRRQQQQRRQRHAQQRPAYNTLPHCRAQDNSYNGVWGHPARMTAPFGLGNWSGWF